MKINFLGHYLVISLTLVAVSVLANPPKETAKKSTGKTLVKTAQCLKSNITAHLTAPSAAHLWKIDPTNPDPAQLQYVVENQTELNHVLQEHEGRTIETGELPEEWGSGKMALSHYLEGMPVSVKQAFVLQLLRKNGENPEVVVKLIEGLEAEEGVREAVVKYIAECGYLGDTKGLVEAKTFTDDQIRAMFGGKRFQKFFPWVDENTSLAVNPREKLLLADKTSPIIAADQGLNPAILSEGEVDRKHYEPVISSSSVRQTLGYDPLVLPRILKDEMDADFHLDGLTPDQQIRGLIVQGHYERDGDSLYVDFASKRGVADIESDVPKINRALRDNLETGALNHQPPLYQRLFTYNWAMNSNPSLIADLRQTALRVAEVDKAFTPLRIEIHAFPTTELYARVEAYVKKYKAAHGANSKAAKLMDQCINQMQGVLGIGKNGRTLANVIDELKAPKKLMDQIHEFTAPFESLPTDQKLEMVAQTRFGWHRDRLTSGTASDHFDFYTGDRELALMAMRLEKQLIDKLPKDPQKQLDYVERLGKQILHQVHQDDFLAEGQVNVINEQLSAIAQDKKIPVERRLELISDLLNSSVDQVYYALKRPFGDYDERILRMAAHGRPTTPVRFLDGTLRSNNVFMLSQLVDAMEESALARKNITHLIGSQKTRIPARVFNPGQTVGILRLNKNPMELTPAEIGVFSEMPTESGAVGGVVTLGVGARLSHLQLLARSLKIPNVKFSNEAVALLKPYDGQMVSFKATKDGAVEIVPLASGTKSGSKRKKLLVTVPEPDHSITKPITFDKAQSQTDKTIAGPKGLTLVDLRTNPALRDSVPDGFILPFGFFRRYLKEVGIEPLVDALGKIDQKNTRVVAEIAKQIREAIAKNPIPDKMLQEIMADLEKLQKRTGHKAGYFFRSDTNIEDLAGFNGAGLNESVPNVKPDEKSVQAAVRAVWESPFKEKSIFWRGLALGTKTVPLAEPSIVVMPTVFAESSGVIISKGTSRWVPGKGFISANWGIGSVVEAGAPVEEITLEGRAPLRTGLTSSAIKPTASSSGGLKNVAIQPGYPVLKPEQITELNAKAQLIEETLGVQPKGYDIEWAVDASGKVWIVQARPNT